MTSENESSDKVSPRSAKISAAEEAKRRRVTLSIIAIMIILGGILLGFVAYQYLLVTQQQVYVLDVKVEVKEIGGFIHIVRIETSRRQMDLLESPRTDDLSIFPGVRVKILRGQEVLSYDRFTSYHVDGTHNIVVGLRHMPRQNDILVCTAWIFTGNQGAYADDQESVTIVWSEVRNVNVLRIDIGMEGSLETGSNAQITGVSITQDSGTLEIGNGIGYYPGVYGYVQKNDQYLSFIASKPYDPPGNYTLYIGLLFEPRPEEILTVIIQVWQRNGEWLEGEYQSVTDSHSQSYTWS